MAWVASTVSATALTYRILANEKACFYAATDNKGVKIAFYFAVRLPPPTAHCPLAGMR